MTMRRSKGESSSPNGTEAEGPKVSVAMKMAHVQTKRRIIERIDEIAHMRIPQ